MKSKSKLWPHKSIFRDVATSFCLLGASAGIVFGVSAGMFKIQYMDLTNPEARLFAANNNSYTSENIVSKWNMEEVKDASGNVTIPGVDMEEYGITKNMTTLAEWQEWHSGATSAPFLNSNDLGMSTAEGNDITAEQMAARYNKAAMVIDGATHSTMDRSFNQSLYEGLVNFVKNKSVASYDPEGSGSSKNSAQSYKPTQDNTTEFINTYTSVIKQSDIVGLAGFNHATPLNSMMQHAEIDGGVSAFASVKDNVVNELAQKTGFILLDSNISNNQNIASVQFRADQPGFLTALATCEYFVNNLDMYHDNYQDLAVAEFGGVAIPTVVIYMGGFQRGIEFWNYTLLKSVLVNGANQYFGANEGQAFEQCKETFEKLVTHSKYKDEIEALKQKQPAEAIATFQKEYAQKLYEEYAVKIIKLGDVSNHFSGTFAAGDAVGITKQYLNRGAQAIIAVAGPQSLDAAKEIQAQKSKCIVIGVDSAMEDGDYQRYHSGVSSKEYTDTDPYVDKNDAPDGSHSSQANSIIKFSAVKDIKTVSNKITRLICNGQNWDVSATDESDTELNIPDPENAVCGPGFQTCCNIKNGLISISWDGFYPLVQALMNVNFLGESGQSDFAYYWSQAVDAYSKNPKTAALWAALPTEYKEGIAKISNLLTYKRADDKGNPTVWYQNYSTTMAILGILLNTAQITFNRTMTLKINEQTGQYEVLGEKETKDMSILDWLETNMYFSC